MSGPSFNLKDVICISAGAACAGFVIGNTLPSVLRWINDYFFKDNDLNFELTDELLFFSNNGNSCRSHFIQEDEKRPCGLLNCSFYNLSRMLHYLNSAKESLDVCMYLITVKDLGRAILQAHNRGVKVRVITDEDMGNGSGTQIHSFRHSGIPVRNEIKSKVLMHHKWVIIDGEMVMCGSLNWTMQGICSNYDNLLITNQPNIVAGFQAEFERLWVHLK